MDKNRIKKVATWIIVPFMILIFVLDIFTVILGNHYSKRYTFIEEDYSKRFGDDRIHFLNTANSDCILIESNGRFALIDSGEGNNNPRRHTPCQGFEERVISYLKKVASKNGKVHLDFVLCTHYHYDHAGGYEAIFKDKNILIDTAYFKEFNTKIARDYESERWGLQNCYNNLMSMLEQRGIRIQHDIPEEIPFGDFRLDLYNTGIYEDLYGKGENSACIGIKVTKGKSTAFLAGDITRPSGVEEKIKDEVGQCDLLKIGHHGYYGSSSMSFLKVLKPKLAIVTNMQGKVYPNVTWNLTMYARIPFYGTYDYNGIIANFSGSDEIKLTNNLHKEIY